MDAGSFIR